MKLYFLAPTLLAICSGSGSISSGNDGGPPIDFAVGTWQLEWSCNQQGERLTGCDVGEIYWFEEPDKVGIVWNEGSANTVGDVVSNEIVATFAYGPEGHPDTVIEDVVYTFDRSSRDTFTKTSSYGSATGPSGTCTGQAVRVNASVTSCP